MVLGHPWDYERLKMLKDRKRRGYKTVAGDE
jgi:hypothetical protein